MQLFYYCLTSIMLCFCRKTFILCVFGPEKRSSTPHPPTGTIFGDDSLRTQTFVLPDWVVKIRSFQKYIRNRIHTRKFSRDSRRRRIETHLYTFTNAV